MSRIQTHIDKNAMYGGSTPSWLTDFRNNLYGRFSKNIMLLLDSKKPRTTFTHKGRLEPRRAYRYKFSDQLFKQNQSVPTSDTTIIFLIDGSGSMDGERIRKSTAICSAFAKSINDVTRNQIKFECFVKHAPCVGDEQYGGSFVSVTKVLSNVGKTENDFDKILTLDATSPFVMEGNDYGSGSYTSEFAIMPAIRKYMAKKLTTKNAIVVNLTDGGAYCSLGNGFSFRSVENGQMRVKYLSQIPHVTVIVGSDISKGERDEAYGNNVIECEDEDFVPKLFKLFMGFLENAYEN